MVRQQDVLDLIAVGANGNGHARPEAPVRTTRFSAAARKLIEEHNLDPALFEGSGLVRLQDVQALLQTAERPRDRETAITITTYDYDYEPSGTPTHPHTHTPTPSAGVPRRNEPLPRRKRIEAKYLASGVHNTLTSTVAVACPTSGLRAAAKQAESIDGNATAIIVYEAARLLREYPELNAFCEGDEISFYEQVNVGFAVDAGQGLKVPVIRNADRKSMAEIAGEMRELVVAYLSGDLSPEALSGGTFTVSDLSGEGAFVFNPLINQGQAAILGVGGEFFPPGCREGMFNLILAFDHQLSEGRRAAQFLGALRDRLAAYEKALGPGSAPDAETLCCSRCLLPYEVLQERRAHLIPTMRPDGSTRLLCSTCLQGWW
jgi:2-oxoglutarate dehydrogenase E2 component (dihydrolipoamide succinyltransferase)